MNFSDCKGQDFGYLPYRSGPQGCPGWLVRHLLYWLNETPLELWSNVLTESEWWREGWYAGFFSVMAYSFVCYPITSLNLFALDFQRRYAIRWCLNLRSLLPVSLMKEILEELSCHIYSWCLSITPLIGQTRARMAENTSPGLVCRCFCAPFSILAVTFDPSVNTMQITSIWQACFGAHVAGNKPATLVEGCFGPRTFGSLVRVLLSFFIILFHADFYLHFCLDFI
jgi:hypothetical protein